MKVTDKYFIDWESSIFGYGYGTGEQYTLKALKDFMKYLDDSSYDYDTLERKMGSKTVAWLMINILCHADILEYGTSPRYGWLSEKGILLREYLKNKTVDQLYELTNVNSDYVHCYKTHCNCDVVKCLNPLF